MKTRYEIPRQPHSESPMGPLAPPTPIVGRQQELALVMNHYKAAKEGLARVVLLTGEPGIGKTRLLDEVALWTAQDGAIVLRGNASEAEGMPPFLPFLEAFGRYIRVTPQEQLRMQVATVPQLLANLLPELAVYLHDLHVAPPLPPEQTRLRLYEAIGTFLSAVSQSRPLVLMLDATHVPVVALAVSPGYGFCVLPRS